MRWSDSGRNSIWRSEAWVRRGTVTTPAMRVSEDNSAEAEPTTSPSPLRTASISACSRRMAASDSGCTFSNASTNSRMPFGVGTRPAEVCGATTSPISSRSAMTLRMVAGDRSSPESFDRVREPTGWPSRI